MSLGSHGCLPKQISTFLYFICLQYYKISVVLIEEKRVICSGSTIKKKKKDLDAAILDYIISKALMEF